MADFKEYDIAYENANTGGPVSFGLGPFGEGVFGIGTLPTTDFSLRQTYEDNAATSGPLPFGRDTFGTTTFGQGIPIEEDGSSEGVLVR